MSTMDWLIVAAMILIVIGVALQTQKYVKGVADFLTAGRVAGRYVVCVAGGEAAMGLISLVALFEVYYNNGFAYNFWSSMAAPVGIVMGLTGFCVYRFRETRAMTMGQFFELRYDRKFRIFAGILQSISGIINYGIFPAVGARFIMYYCGFPCHVEWLGFSWPTMNLLMLLFLGLAVTVAVFGGQITIMATDCVQGLLSYPMYVVIVIALMLKFSWFNEMAPCLLARPGGESMLNPFDIEKLRNFNLFFVVVGIFSSIINRMAWSGSQGYNAAALNAHEQKMGGILGTWRSGFSSMMYVLLGIAAFTFMHHANYADQAVKVRNELDWQAMNDVAPDRAYSDLAPSPDAVAGRLALLKTERPGLHKTVMTIQSQMTVPMALRYILPVGVTGLLCALGIFLMVSTDTTYLHSWGSILIQDVVLPLRGKAIGASAHLLLLRLAIAGVAVFAFFFSALFSQMDFILMFFAITGAIWLGGAGACIVFGLYWKRGNTAGAWSALLAGSAIATTGIVMQQMWASTLYPWLDRMGRVETVGRIVAAMSAPFEPYIAWRVTPTTFPVNSQEIFFLAMATSIFLYVAVSLLTCREPFNMDRLLHRGAYNREGICHEPLRWSLRNALKKMIGIDAQYTHGDKILAWSVFIYSFGWNFLVCFVGVVFWNLFIGKWPSHWWSNWFFFCNIVLGIVLGTVSTVWFSIGGTVDLFRMFRLLGARAEQDGSALDDGRVEGHVNADDLRMVDAVESRIGDARPFEREVVSSTKEMER